MIYKDYKFTVPPEKMIRVITDTDAKNEADDQFAVVHDEARTRRYGYRRDAVGDKFPHNHGTEFTDVILYLCDRGYLREIDETMLERVFLRNNVSEGTRAVDDDGALSGLGDLPAEPGDLFLIECPVLGLVGDNATTQLNQHHRSVT